MRKWCGETGANAFIWNPDRREMVQDSDAVPVGEVGWFLEGEGADDIAEQMHGCCTASEAQPDCYLQDQVQYAAS